MDKEVNKLHLIYGYILFFVILVSVFICWILTCKGVISDTAFQNFSFASSVVSIVLAVVSITFSFYSSSGLSGSIGVINEAEHTIKGQVEMMKSIDLKISQLYSDTGLLKEQLTNMSAQMEPMISGILINNSSSDNSNMNSTEQYSYKQTSNLGAVVIYICLKSAEKNKAWAIDILGDQYKSYIQGYLVALSSVPSVGFSFNATNDFTQVTDCSFSAPTFKPTSKEVKDYLMTIGDEAKEVIKKIDDTFDK